VQILKEFKFHVFGSADCKGVTHAFFGSADSKGVTVGVTFGGGSQRSRRLGQTFELIFEITLIKITYW